MRLHLRLTVPLLVAAVAALAVASAQGAKPPSPPPPGQGPKLQLNPGTATFGPVAPGVGESQEFVLGFKNGTTSGGLSVTVSGVGFAITADTCTGTAISTSRTCTVTVTYTPTGYSQTSEGTLTATGKRDVKPASALLAGSSTEEPEEPPESLVSAEPGLLDFGGQTVGVSYPALSITFTNNATETLSLAETDPPDGFAPTTSSWMACDDLAAGATCIGNIRFNPTAPGNYQGSFTTRWTNAAGETVSTTVAVLEGHAFADLMHTSVAWLEFGSVTAGTVSAAQDITFTNVSTDTLKLGSSSIYASDVFKLTANNCWVEGSAGIEPGQTCTVSFTFNPPPGLTETTPYSGSFETDWVVAGAVPLPGQEDVEPSAITKTTLIGTGEVATLPGLSINDAPWVYSNNNAIVTFTVSMSKTSGTNVTFNWAATDDSAYWGTTCDKTADYTSAAMTGTGTITAGQTTTTITFGTCNNGPANVYPITTPTYFTVTISNPSGATITTDTGKAEIRIT